MKYLLSQLLFVFLFLEAPIFGQSVIKGKILDEETAEGLPGVQVHIKGGQEGTITDFEGNFELASTIPLVLQISFSSYDTIYLDVKDSKFITLILHRSKEFDEILIKGSYPTDKIKESPLSRNRYDIRKIALNPAADLYSGIGMEKDIDIASGSIAMRTINTRGFNSVAPVRMLQIIDGVDNQSPGLNFSLGNFLGASELDLYKIDIIVGASSPYYGPNAFNGVISMETKDPFIFQGLSSMIKFGERNLFEAGLRYAAAEMNKLGKEWMAYKFNLYALTVRDWKAQNYNPITDSKVSGKNPGRYDAVNIYGDEYVREMDVTLDEGHLFSSPGLGNYYRIGYREEDLVEYDTRNLKANAVLQFRLKPDLDLFSPEIILSSSFGGGNTIYQGDNRFNLRNIRFFQQKIELRKRESYFLRAYYTNENAGKSFDPYFTAIRLLEEGKSEKDWINDYTDNWYRVYYPKMCELGYPKFEPLPEPHFDFAAAEKWLSTYNDSMQVWHNQNALAANQIEVGNLPGTQGYLMPGTTAYKMAFDDIISRLNNEAGGTMFYDRSALLHFHGEYIFKPWFLRDWTVGGNYRIYFPDSKGTIFQDTSGTSIRNHEFGVYTGMTKSFFKNKPLILSGTFRLDKNENFRYVSTYAAGLVFQPQKNTFFRLSLSSALRNPTLTDQYLYLNVGPAILSGHVNPVDSLITPKSFNNYRGSLDLSKLEYFDLEALRPEFVRTIEVGIRTTVFNNLYLDAGYYLNNYQHFLGYIIGISSQFQNPPLPLPYNTKVFRYTTNSTSEVITEGFSASADFQMDSQFTLRANYSYNALRKTNEDDPIIPAYNTPKDKFNVGLIAQNLEIVRIGSFDQLGFMVNYKWVRGFEFEGSPQFTGYVPSYGNVDAQFNLKSERLHTMIKVGASNLLNNQHFETYGGPTIGRMAYMQLVYQL